MLAGVKSDFGLVAQYTTDCSRKDFTMPHDAKFQMSLVILSLLIAPTVPGESRRLANGGADDTTAQVPAAPIAPEVFARRVLAIVDAVLDNHVDPPTRQELVLAAARVLTRQAGRPVPAGLSARVSALATDEELSKLLAALWSEAQRTETASDERLQTAALQAITQTIPGRPSIIPASEMRVLQQLSASRYVGIGIQLDLRPPEGLPRIVTSFPHGAARQAGAKPGDLMLDVDGVSTQGRSLSDVVQMLRGEAGTRVVVTVRQPDSSETRTLDMTRAEVPIETVHGYRRLENDSWVYQAGPAESLAYLRLASVTASTLHELRQAARLIESQAFRGLVLDLRNHAGSATLEHFLFVADELLEEVPIGRSVDAVGNTRDFAARPDSLFKRLPLVVLVNRYTRGNPELLAAALQDSGRATIVGEPTAGDAYIRRAVELPDGLGSLVLRSGIWHRPSGRPLLRPDMLTDAADVVSSPGPSPDHPWGIQPDHVVLMTDEQLGRWLSQRRSLELPGTKPDAGEPDAQLQKAVELLQSAVEK
jgi:carboxyl-terminal processing protease